jgi:hypothetical protein
MDESTPFMRERTWVSFKYALKEKFYPFENYDQQCMIWATMCQKRDQMVLENTNIFHTLCSNMGIKDFDQNLFLKYRSGFHSYIQREMDFLDISLPGDAY